MIVVAIAVLVWAPRHQVPAAPTGVRAQSPTATSVLVSWAPSQAGTTRYLVQRDGKQVGSVPVGQTSYLDRGLAPGTAHRYTVIATSGRQRSSPSLATTVTTITPSPVSLRIRRQTRTTVAFDWSPAPNAPVPTQYVIYRGGTSIATVPGTVDAYRAAGLTPGTAYQYQVAARWGQRESSPSAALATVTLAPPLQGDVPVQLTTVSTPGSGASLKVGQKWSDTWTFSSACTANRCTLTTDAEFAAPGFTSQPFTMTLKFSNARYTGTAQADITKCGSASVKNTITLNIAARPGAVRHGGWNAWSGTMVLSSPYVRASSSTYCPAQSWSFSITGTHG